MNIGETIARSAHRNPDGDAIIDPDTNRRSTFAEMNSRVNRLSHALRGELGLDKGDRVAILAKNSTEFMETFYAAAKTGTIAQPMNWRLAVPEMARILENGSPKAIIVNEEFRPQMEELQGLVDIPHWITFDPNNDSPLEDLLARHPDHEPPLDAADDDPFFILYTGGTTGVPKGALHSHRSAFTFMLNQTAGERIADTDVYMLTGQMFHIPVVIAMNYLAFARPVVLITFEPGKALELIEQERVSGFLAITTMLNLLLNHEDFPKRDLSSLRMVQYGGGPMPEAVIRRAIPELGCQLTQAFGQTEGGTMTFLPPWVHDDALEGKNLHRLKSCGREAHLTSVRVLDEDGDPVPRDGETVGEIVVRSEANMLRYWNQPEMTAQTVRDGWMWTGDAATWDEDGFVYIVDRKKEMIISGGENIYPAQVEQVLYRHPSVLAAAVVGIPDDEWGEAVHAEVVLKPGETATEDELIDLVRSELASYMKPRSVAFVDELPMSPTGKIMKHVIKKPFWEGQDRNV